MDISVYIAIFFVVVFIGILAVAYINHLRNERKEENDFIEDRRSVEGDTTLDDE